MLCESDLCSVNHPFKKFMTQLLQKVQMMFEWFSHMIITVFYLLCIRGLVDSLHRVWNLLAAATVSCAAAASTATRVSAGQGHYWGCCMDCQRTCCSGGFPNWVKWHLDNECYSPGATINWMLLIADKYNIKQISSFLLFKLKINHATSWHKYMRWKGKIFVY